MDNFIIFVLGRSGTTNLSGALSNGIWNEKVIEEPFIVRGPEAVNFKHLRRVQSQFGVSTFPDHVFSGKIGLYLKGKKDVYSFCDFLYEKWHGIKHVFSSVPNTINIPLINYLAEKNIKILFLRRKDILESALSSHLINQTGIMAWSKENKKYVNKFNYQPIDCDRILETADVMYDKINTLRRHLKEKVNKIIEKMDEMKQSIMDEIKSLENEETSSALSYKKIKKK